MGRVMMWANMRRGPSLAVPAPFDDNSSPYWWYDRIASWAQEWSKTGFTDVLFPNPVKGQSGAYRTGDGYNPFDHWDVGSKNQLGRMETRFGNADQWRRAAAICQANGMNVLLDIVMHQCMGGKAGVYRYVSSTGTTNGRFPKDPGCFSPSGPGDTIPPYVPVDPVPDQPDNYPFGNPLAPVNSVPKNYVWDNLLKVGDWWFRTSGADGARLDDMKGTNVGFIKAFMTYGRMKDKWFFGEYASGNPNDTNWWVGQVDGLSNAADFGFHYNMAQPMCNDASYDMSSLKNNWNAMFQTNPMKAVTFVESMDSDTDGFATIVFNKELAEALMLCSEGLPQVYIRDYLQEEYCYGLKPGIDNLVWCHQMLGNGPTVSRYASNHIWAFERTGDPGALITLNNDYFNSNWYTITAPTSFGANVRLHDFTGHNQSDSWTDNYGNVTVGVPPAANGVGYGVWAPAYMQGRAYIPWPSRETNQDFDGDVDLDISPLTTTMTKIGRVWCDKGKAIVLNMDLENPNLSVPHMMVLNPDGTTLVQGKATRVSDYTIQRGWHTLWGQLVTSGTATTMPFSLHVRYTATKDLQVSEFNT